MWRSPLSSALGLIGNYRNKPMFYIRTFDYITTLLISGGSAGGQGALSRLTPGSLEHELQSGTWQWMSANGLDGICFTGGESQSPGAIWSGEEKQRPENKPPLVPEERDATAQLVGLLCRMMNNHTQMTAPQLQTHRSTSALPGTEPFEGTSSRMIRIVCLDSAPVAAVRHRSLSERLGEPLLQASYKRSPSCSRWDVCRCVTWLLVSFEILW